MENSTWVKVTSTKVTVAKTGINYFAARAKSRSLWNCKIDLSRNEGGRNLHLCQSSVTFNTTEYSCTCGTYASDYSCTKTLMILSDFAAERIFTNVSQVKATMFSAEVKTKGSDSIKGKGIFDQSASKYNCQYSKPITNADRNVVWQAKFCVLNFANMVLLMRQMIRLLQSLWKQMCRFQYCASQNWNCATDLQLCIIGNTANNPFGGDHILILGCFVVVAILEAHFRLSEHI